jgi:hypothetical protein
MAGFTNVIQSFNNELESVLEVSIPTVEHVFVQVVTNAAGTLKLYSRNHTSMPWVQIEADIAVTVGVLVRTINASSLLKAEFTTVEATSAVRISIFGK